MKNSLAYLENFVPSPISPEQFLQVCPNVSKYFGAPGTGKTTRLLALLRGILRKGYTLEDIQIISFSRSATIEFDRRLAAMLKDKTHANRIRCCTLHTLSLQSLGYPDSNILDQGSAKYRDEVVKFIYKHGGELRVNSSGVSYDVDSISDRRSKPKLFWSIRWPNRALDGHSLYALILIFGYIDYLVNGCKKPDLQDFLNYLTDAHRTSHYNPEIETVHEDMMNTFRKMSSVRFYELLEFCVRIRKKMPYVHFSDLLLDMSKATRLRPKYVKPKVVLIDECQDLSKLQWKSFLNYCKLVKPKKIAMAGDDDQAIYIWAGVDPNDFLDIEASKEYVLNTTYRLPKDVAELSFAYIEDNVDKRKFKKVSSTDKSGGVNAIYRPDRHVYSYDELRQVVRELPDLSERKGQPILVVYRANKVKAGIQTNWLNSIGLDFNKTEQAWECLYRMDPADHRSKLKQKKIQEAKRNFAELDSDSKSFVPLTFLKRSEDQLNKLLEANKEITGPETLLLMLQTELYLMTWLQDGSFELHSNDWDNLLGFKKYNNYFKACHGKLPNGKIVERFSKLPLMAVSKQLFEDGVRIYNPIVVGTAFDFKGKEAPYVVIAYTLNVDEKDGSEARVSYVAMTRAEYHLHVLFVDPSLEDDDIFEDDEDKYGLEDDEYDF